MSAATDFESFFSALVTVHLCGRRVGERLVDVDTNAEDVRLACGLEDAVARLAGNLEEHVHVVLVDELAAERLARHRVVERLHEVALGYVVTCNLDVGLDRFGADLKIPGYSECTGHRG